MYVFHDVRLRESGAFRTRLARPDDFWGRGDDGA
jgi:hypothetical protein